MHNILVHYQELTWLADVKQPPLYTPPLLCEKAASSLAAIISGEIKWDAMFVVSPRHNGHISHIREMGRFLTLMAAASSTAGFSAPSLAEELICE